MLPTPYRVAQFVGGAATGIVVLVQLVYAVGFCNWGPIGFVALTGLTLSPAIAFLFSSNPYRSVGAAIAVLPFVIWANQVECVWPASSGGAAMMYVAVWLYGIPAALLLGFWIGKKLKPFLVAEMQANPTAETDAHKSSARGSP